MDFMIRKIFYLKEKEQKKEINLRYRLNTVKNIIKLMN